MDGQHSTLELVIHDQTANFPEHDRSLNAPELDYTLTTPQLSCAEGAEVAVHRSLPEVVAVEVEKQRDQSVFTHVSRLFNSSKTLHYILLMAIILVVTSVAVGLGFGLGTKGHTPKDSTTATGAAGATKHGILNNTKLEAITMSNGDGRVYFQDNSGFIRESIYTALTRNWTAGFDNVVAIDAKNCTPLAAVNIVSATGDPSLDEPVIYYISTGNCLRSRHFNKNPQNSWVDDDNGISKITPIANSTSLSATLTNTKPAPTQNSTKLSRSNSSVVLVFQDMYGNVSAVSIATDPGSDWVDVSETLHTSSAVPGPVIAISSASDSNSTITATIICLDQKPEEALVPGTITFAFSTYNSSNNENRSWDTTDIQPSPSNPLYSGLDPKTFDTTQVAFYNTSGSGLLLGYALAIEGSAMYQLPYFDKVGTYAHEIWTWPASPFPFARLASTAPTNSSVFYLYHQINDVVFAEDTYDATSGSWTATNFSISVG